MEVLHWSAHALGHPTWLDVGLAVAGTGVLAFVGGGFYRSAFEAAKRGTSNMDTLISIGATTAWIFSVLVLVGRGRGVLEGQPTYFAEMAALLGLISLGHWLEARASAGAGAAIRELLDLQPELALRRREDGDFEEVPSSMLVSGDVVRIHPGERVPIDGRVIEGRSALDESVLTGESLPVDRSVGDPVIAGAINTTGSLIVEATVAGAPPMFDIVFKAGELTNYRDTLGADAAKSKAFNAGLLEHGILKGDNKFYVSLAHTDEDVAKTLDAFDRVLANLD